MLTVNAAAQAYRERRADLIQIPMLYIESRDFVSGELHGIGLWRGDDIESVSVPDLKTGIPIVRTFYNAGLLSIGDVRYESGLNIRPISIGLSAISDPVLVAFRQYNARGAEVQLWRRCYDINRKPIAVEAWDFGYVNTAPSERPTSGGEFSISVEIVSEVRMLTQGSELRKSDQAQRRRLNDAFRQYKAVTVDWTVPWGTKDVRVK